MSLERPTYYVYIVTGFSLRAVLYVGVTSNLVARIEARRNGEIGSFTARYHLWKLVYAQAFPHVRDAIAWEKRLKGWRRERKIALIDAVNPCWRTLEARSW